MAPSEALASFLRMHLRVPGHRVRTIHNGVSVPGNPSGDGCQGNGVITFVTVSSFARCKAVPMLIDAFATLCRDGAALRLRLVGDGEDMQECRSRVMRAGIERSVEFMGYRRDVPAQIATADAFVLPSLNENMPLALLEAMAAGLPSIASDIGGIPEALDQTSGILVRPGDASALVSAMRHLVEEDGLARRMGLAARKRVQRGFSISDCADAYEELWNRMDRRSPRSRSAL